MLRKIHQERTFNVEVEGPTHQRRPFPFRFPLPLDLPSARPNPFPNGFGTEASPAATAARDTRKASAHGTPMLHARAAAT